MSNRKGVSVALAACNGATFIREQLESIARQSTVPDEVVISDDASSDATLLVVEDFGRTAPFAIRSLANRYGHGHLGNIRTAIEACETDIVLLANQDDVWLPSHISRLVQFLRGDDRVVAVLSDSAVVTEDLQGVGQTVFQAHRISPAAMRRINRSANQIALLAKNFTARGHGMAIRRELLAAATPFSDMWPHDAWLTLVAAAVGRVYFLPETLTLYRCHHPSGRGLPPAKSLATWARESRVAGPTIAQLDVAKWSAYADHLDAHRSCFANYDQAAATARAKVEFLRVRGAIRHAPLPRRLVQATMCLLAGRYHRLTRGLLAYARDVYGSE